MNQEREAVAKTLYGFAPLTGAAVIDGGGEERQEIPWEGLVGSLKHGERAHADLMRRRADAILALRSGGEGWQDISTAPKDGTRVLVHDGREPVVAFWHEDVRWERDRHASTADRDVTERVVGGWWEAYAETVVHPAHWKPLNAPSPSTHGEG